MRANGVLHSGVRYLDALPDLMAIARVAQRSGYTEVKALGSRNSCGAGLGTRAARLAIDFLSATVALEPRPVIFVFARY